MPRAILYTCILIILASPLFAKTILVPVDSYPPFHIFPEDGGPPYGEVISILKAVVDHVNQKHGYDFKLRFTRNTPFKRCLGMMRKGKADLIGGLLNKEDRCSYMHLLKYKPNSNKIFLLRKNESNDILKFEDLKGQKVGTIIGYVYFNPFDSDAEIRKDPVPNLILSLEKLKHHRYNVAICAEMEWKALRESDPAFASNFKEATYKYSKPNPVYIGISKKSWLGRTKYLEAFKEIVEDMYKKNQFIEIIQNFYKTLDEK
ncbi:substrate-binding periplasmic protein [Desulfospira joergensenii]|uniref:substrate-binding periplasmic protein n=1 Tax=Desulfospira joergensenii TaxID=53329 RepID=UPI0003B77B05|nr:transporter substrate-binding domain-containing protein [Desulfospira joergensenii]